MAVNRAPQEGPWGGVNQFLKSLETFLVDVGDQVVYGLSDPDIDIILLVVPRRRGARALFAGKEALSYLLRHPDVNTQIVHRVNDCDERKGTRGVNRRLKRLNSLADHTIFIGSWMTNLDLWLQTSEMTYSTIHNGADTDIFFPREQTRAGGEPLKLVTHHWSSNWRKGFDIYLALDRLLDDPLWSSRIEFTYIGNIPEDLNFRNTRVVAPISGKELADELRKHDAYVTASNNEPGGMHQVEAIMTGLPVVYKLSGALPETCEGYGVPFRSSEDFVEALSSLIANYDYWRSHVLEAEYSAIEMARKYRTAFMQVAGRSRDMSARERVYKKVIRRIRVA